MPFLTTANLIRQIEWSRSFLWDIKLVGAPHPFDKWFPAISVEEPLGSVESHQVTAFNTTIKLPLGTTAHEIKVQFVDDAKHTLSKYIKNWMNSITYTENYVLTIKEAVKRLHIQKLYPDRTILSENVYYVYPEGVHSFNGSSTSDALLYDLTLVIAGESGHSVKDIAAISRDTAIQFINNGE